ncbi:DUF547 domain-containing protein [Lutibaculum baratangense]|uniref:Uncharacterized protein n=1 Tax=Lutibaculum baratangense AMV1 TaxID=631454 RepID=V4RER3_9HYPH|nr:DUF547 domain-containing protein [Lutibaculum baratangense]ESR24631.1 putative membrane protein of unknown function [Lutibaculum baratangense AMV1]
MPRIRPVYLVLLVFLSAAVAAHLLGLGEVLSFQTVRDHRDALLAHVDARPIVAAAIFFTVYASIVALSLPAATVLSLLGGFLFGRWAGTALIVGAATCGAVAIFWIASTSLGESLRRKAGPLYHRVARNLQENAFGYLLFLRLVPLFPFFLVNIVPAMFGVRTRTFAITTLLGIMPGSFVYANLGGELASISDPADLISAQTLLAFSLLGLMALLPTIYTQLKRPGRQASAMIVLLAAAIGGAGAVVPTFAVAGPYDKFVETYDSLLGAHVATARRNGIIYHGVDYRAWASDPRHVEARQILLSSDPATGPAGNDRLAYWINAYNFLTIDLIVGSGEQRSIKNLGNLIQTAWQRHKWAIAGREYSLDDIEHGIIRPMGDARIHFAINCAAISCPDLRTEAYRGDRLDEQLDDQVAATLANPSKGLRRETAGVVEVSKVMDWFSEDFSQGDLRVWLTREAGVRLPPDVEIRFLGYDWTLNSR